MLPNVNGEVVRVVVEKNHQLLGVQSRRLLYPNEYEIPGGKVETGETYLAAGRRELREETGLIMSCGKIVLIYDRRTPFGTYWRYIIIRAITWYGSVHISDSREIHSIGWLREQDKPRFDHHTKFMLKNFNSVVGIWQR